MISLKLGASTLAFTAEPIPAAVQKIANLGFAHIEVLWRHDDPHVDHYKAQLVELKKTHGFELSVHCSAELDLANLNSKQTADSVRKTEACLAFAAAVGAGTVTIHLGKLSPHGWEVDTESIARKICVESVEACAQKAKKFNLIIAVENMPRVPNILGQTLRHLMRILDEVKSDNLGITLDIGHAFTVDHDLKFIETMGDRIVHVHLHDNDGAEDQHLALGKGALDFRSAVQRLARIDYEGPLVLEMRNIEDVITSRNLVRELLEP